MKLRMIAIVLMLPIMINLLVFSSSDIVVEAQTIRVTGVVLDREEVVFDRLETSQYLIATVLPAQAQNTHVTFLSANPEIATVNEHGLVTAISNGITTITVTTADGGFIAISSIIVESFFIETFEVELTDSNVLFVEDTVDLTVKLAPIQGMGNDTGLPFIRTNHPGIIDVTSFEVISSNLKYNVFKTQITAMRVGAVTITVSVIEARTGIVMSRNIEIDVRASEDGPIGFLFGQMTYSEEHPLTTITSEIPLRVNRQADNIKFTIREMSDVENEIYDQEETVAFIDEINDELHLIFNESGYVILDFVDDYAGYGSVKIISTFGSLDWDALDAEFEEFDGLSVLLRRTRQINIQINPNDFAEYYNIQWNNSDNISLQVIESTWITITPTMLSTALVPYHWFEIVVTNRITNQTYERRIYIDVVSFGASDIMFELNNPALSKRGLEQTIVFGNQRHDGQNFIYQIRFRTTGSPGFTQRLVFTSSNPTLATVDDNGVVTFNANFNGFENNRAFVKIRATSNYESIEGYKAYTYFIFEVINAANVHDFIEYNQANQDNRDIVLQGTISFFNPFNTSVSVFGNGHQLEASQFTNTLDNATVPIFTFFNDDNFLGNNNTIISNVVFSGFAEETDDLSQFATRGALLTLNANTTLQYSVLQRAAILLYIRVDAYTSHGIRPNRNILVQRNILRHAGLAGAFLGESHNQRHRTENIVFEDLIFEMTLIGILFTPALIGHFSHTIMGEEVEMHGAYSRDDLGVFELTLRGELKFYNWLEASIFNRQSIDLFGLPLGFSRLSLNNFDFDVYEDEDGTMFIQLVMVKLDGTVASNQSNVENELASRGLFDVVDEMFYTNNAVGEFNIFGILISLTANVYNPCKLSSWFISPSEQLAHFYNPDYSLVTRPVAF